jgi:hypothetical protein
MKKLTKVNKYNMALTDANYQLYVAMHQASLLAQGSTSTELQSLWSSRLDKISELKREIGMLFEEVN